MGAVNIICKAGNTRSTMLRNFVAQQKLRNNCVHTRRIVSQQKLPNSTDDRLLRSSFFYQYAGTSKSTGDIHRKVQGFRARVPKNIQNLTCPSSIVPHTWVIKYNYRKISTTSHTRGVNIRVKSRRCDSLRLLATII